MKKNRKKSFVRTCLIQNSLSLLIILLLCLSISAVVNYKLEKSFPVLEDLLKYEDYLQNDEYSKIPLQRFSNCVILIYESNKKMLYSSDKTIGEELDVNNFDYMNEEYNNSYFKVYDFITKDNEKQYYIMKIDSTNGEQNLVDFAILNSNLDIIDGDLFSEKHRISELQLDLMSGKYQNYTIEKYLYKNSDGESRTLVFLGPNFNTENYETTIKDANQLWLISIPFILIIILIEMILYKKQIKKSIEPLNMIINSYKNTRQNQIEAQDISTEFQPIANNFKMLINQIEKNETEKNIMIANISHDLKTPLTAIKGYSQAFKDNIVQGNKKEQYLNAIYEKTIVATDLINRLFEFSKLEHPNYKLNMQDIDINEFSREYLAKKNHEIGINGFFINIEIPEDKYICCIDSELITRLYDNMISNILKHNKEGTQILFKIVLQKDIVKIIIADNGEGIPDNIREDLFKPFIIGNKARTSGEGTGLGMAIIKKIIDLHNGKIYLNDNPRKGYVTEFNIEFKSLT